MQTNLINSYIQNKTLPQNSQKPSDNIEIVTRRKAKPDFDINRELANRTFIRPLPPKGHIINDNIWAAPAAFANDMIYDMKALKSAWKGDANDHQLGKLNDVGMKLGGLGIAAYLFNMKKTPVKKGMEFVGLAAFFASMSLWRYLALEIPAIVIHGFNPFMRYEDSQGRKKEFFQDNQYLPYDMISDKTINRVAKRRRIPENMPNKRDAVQDEMRTIALQNYTMWMLTAGPATPLLSSLICNKLEPVLENTYSYFMNKKVDNILVKFSEVQKKYKTGNIEKDVNSVLEMYKGRPVNDEILDSLSTALTQELNPKVAEGMKADLANMLTSDKFIVSKLQKKTVTETVASVVKSVSNDKNLHAEIAKIIPTNEQLTAIFDKFDGQKLDAMQLKDMADSVVSGVVENLQKLNKNGTKVDKRTVKNIVKAFYGNSVGEGPLMAVLTNRPAKVLDDEAQNTIKKIAARMSDFCAENNALSEYAFKKIAFAPDTSKGKFWNDFVKELTGILEITNEEIASTRYDRPLVAKLLQSKFQKIAADKNKYEQVIKKAADVYKKKIESTVKPDDLKGKYIKQLEASYAAVAKDFGDLGLTRTVEKLVGKNGNDTGSLLKVSKAFVDNNLSSVKNSFARFFNTLNFYRAVVNDPNLDFANHYKIKIGHDHNAYVETRNITQKMLKEVKEEVYALSEFLTVSGRISDYSVKFEFLRNLAPNDKDFGPLTFNSDGTVHFNYYNEKALASKGVFIQSDTNFFKRVMNALFDGPIQQETNSALQEFTIVKNMLEEYRKNMVDEIGNLNNFAFPSKVMLDQWNSDGSRIYSSGSPNLRSLYVGTPLDEMISNTAKLTYNTNKWYKMFKGIGLGLLGVTVLSQFFFGGSKKVDKKK